MEQEAAAEMDSDNDDVRPSSSGPTDQENMDLDDPIFQMLPPSTTEDAPSPSSSPLRGNRVTIEEVEDEDAHRSPNTTDALWEEPWPYEAGTPIREELGAFEKLRQEQESNGHAPWHPFENKEDWELARWLILSGVSQKKINDFLKLDSVRRGIDPAFHNARSLLQRIDALPKGPKWSCTTFDIEGDILDSDGKPRVQEVELWHRDPVECVQELLENPAFKGHQHFQPTQMYSDEGGKNRVYGEMHTADWWWKTQKSLPPGATLCPLILSSDKTSLSRFSGDKSAWPVYISTAIIDKDVRRKPTSYATVLLGYIPVCKLECFTANRRSEEGYNLFHQCMRKMLEPIIKAGREGVEMRCADGFIRLMYLILAAYIADYPEQCLVACCKENSCPRCTVPPDKRGDHRVYSVIRDPDETIELINEKLAGNVHEEFKKQNLRPTRPFWEDLPRCNIFECMTPDLLHQLHKGVFHDHLVSWGTEAIEGGEGEIDERFRTMSPHPSLRHFNRGISLTSQWTGSEHKHMEKVFLGILAGATDQRVVKAARGLLDFIYYAHFEVHTDESLNQLDAAWLMFHENKEVFEELGIRQHFNISKLHNIRHYYESIRSRGTADGFNTENTERLHIDFAKMGYNASNKKNYIDQMTLWLQRQESIHRFSRYLQWVLPGYVVQGVDDDEDDEDEGSEDKSESIVKDSETAMNKADNDDQSAGSFAIAKKAPITGVNAETMTKDFGTINFLYYLEEHLSTAAPSVRRLLTEDTPFSIYKRVVLQLPPILAVSRQPIRDVIHAVKGSAANGRKQAAPGRFSTVLVRTPSKDGQATSSEPLAGMRVAQVRAIFKLPAEFRLTTPLAYIDWFTPFRNPQADTGMYMISQSTNTHDRRASVIPISDIVRSCHLIPVFGQAPAKNLGWKSETVLEQCKKFYFNPYLRHHDFYQFRYLQDLHLKRQSEALAAQQRAAAAAAGGKSRSKKRKRK
ncbi:hypothetical protein CVT26_010393 [Gymnopilus dilepis]|uniref:Uncharacterized protein n=1 Tax=Gymnopilus dilepis TaxID=231916 RepID=A0A409VZ79_9AGAR|nr:hypothetical protein CVT26_010393 [Gymnopilus dilepis]